MARPYVPGIYRPDSTIADMILQQGNQQAQNTANTWGGIAQGIGQLGQGISDYGAQREEKKKADAQTAQLAKRDAAWVSYVESGEWKGDPAKAYATTTRIWGPKDADAHFKGLQGAAQLSQEKTDPKADGEALGQMIGAIDALKDPAARARLYPAAAALAKRKFPELKVEPEYNEATWTEKAELGKQLRGEKPAEAPKPTTIDQQLADPNLTPERRAQLLQIEHDQAAATRAPVQPNQGPAGTWVEAVGADGKPVQLNTTTNQTRPYPEGITPKANARERAVTGAEKQVLAFYNRAQQAIDDIAPLEDTIAKAGYADQARLEYGGIGSNLIQSEEQQQYRQAQRAFTEARLRKESGAAINDKEYEKDARTYFAQPGDKEPVRLQKKAAREKVLDGLRYASGKAYEDYYGSPPPTANNQGSAQKVGGPGGDWQMVGGVKVRRKH